MKIFFSVLLILVLCSCGSNDKHKLNLSASDSVAIRFTKLGYGDSVLKTASATDKNVIKALTDFINKSNATEPLTCGYNGTIIFYKVGKELKSIQFNYARDACGQFIWKEGDKRMSTKMNNEASEFLTRLAEGKNWY